MTEEQTQTEEEAPPPQMNGDRPPQQSPTWPTGEEVLQIAQELYPREIQHAASEARARKAERLLSELQEESE